MARILGELCDRQGADRLVSVGVGNAAVEQLLVAAGIAVEAVDLVAQAVELARRKGVRAVQADVRRWQPSTPVSVLYADGILGHLYDEGTECLDVLRHFATWLNDDGVIVASNDVPPTGDRARPAPGVAHFHWLSAALLSDNLAEAGFTVVRTESFFYDRPLSGRRCRSVVVARAVS
jgi:hypothetical protein